MAGRKQRAMERAIESTAFAEGDNVLDARAGHSILQKTSGGSAQDHFPMFPDMIGMGMTDENPLRTRLRLRSIQPKAKPRKVHAAAMILQDESRHVPTCGKDERQSTGAMEACTRFRENTSH